LNKWLLSKDKNIGPLKVAIVAAFYFFGTRSSNCKLYSTQMVIEHTYRPMYTETFLH